MISSWSLVGWPLVVDRLVVGWSLVGRSLVVGKWNAVGGCSEVVHGEDTTHVY